MRILPFLPIILVLVLAACATGPGPQPSTSPSASPAAPAASPSPAPAAGQAASPDASPAAAPSPEPAAKPKEPAASPKPAAAVTLVVRPFVKTVRVTYPDGFLSGLNEYEYDAQGRLTSDTEKNGSEIMINQKRYAYKPDGGLEITVFDGAGRLKSKAVQTASEGRVIQEKVFNDKDELQSTSDYKYNEAGQKIQWSIQGKGTSTTASEYLWTDGRLARITVLDASRNIIKQYLRSFNAAGNLTGEDELDGKGSLLRKTVYVWQGGNLAREESRTAQDAVLKSTAYSYDPANRLVKSELFNRKGELLEIQLRSWVELSVPATPSK
jgi:hypothetical protein